MIQSFYPEESPARVVTREIARTEKILRKYAAISSSEPALILPAIPDPPDVKINSAVSSLLHAPEQFARMIKEDMGAEWSEEALLGLSAACNDLSDEHMVRFLTEFAGARPTEGYIELLRSILWGERSTDNSEVAQKALEIITTPDALCEEEFRNLLLYRARSYPFRLAALPFNDEVIVHKSSVELADAYDLFGIRCIHSLQKISPPMISNYDIGKQIFSFAYENPTALNPWIDVAKRSCPSSVSKWLYKYRVGQSMTPSGSDILLAQLRHAPHVLPAFGIAMYGYFTNNFAMFRNWTFFTIIGMQVALIESIVRPFFNRTKRLSEEQFSQLMEAARVK